MKGIKITKKNANNIRKNLIKENQKNPAKDSAGFLFIRY